MRIPWGPGLVSIRVTWGAGLVSIRSHGAQGWWVCHSLGPAAVRSPQAMPVRYLLMTCYLTYLLTSSRPFSSSDASALSRSATAATTEASSALILAAAASKQAGKQVSR